ncbi:sugar phosphate nucleotidyltransferase [Selenomonas ruminantium]|uniref:sugar phosphate nucleotidyltransferase n=1 Tax=Selenomonas ruminantium TaxID=971 RepID=UPI0026F16C1F|nr:sugar phosphate nucleotidyltransferase [Selenomonas ruminantium]
MLQKVRKAVIPAAGYGTRFLPATKATPKEMLPIVDKPTIQYIVEEAPSQMAVLGRYVITPQIFSILENTLPGKGGEIQLTDALRVLAHREPVYAYDFEGIRYDVGDKLGFLKATVEYALRRPDLGVPFKNYLHTLF